MGVMMGVMKANLKTFIFFLLSSIFFFSFFFSFFYSVALAADTPTETVTETPTITETATPTATPTSTHTKTPLNTRTPKSTATATRTLTPARTATDTPTPSLTPTVTMTPTLPSRQPVQRIGDFHSTAFSLALDLTCPTPPCLSGAVALTNGTKSAYVGIDIAPTSTVGATTPTPTARSTPNVELDCQLFNEIPGTVNLHTFKASDYLTWTVRCDQVWLNVVGCDACTLNVGVGSDQPR